MVTRRRAPARPHAPTAGLPRGAPVPPYDDRASRDLAELQARPEVARGAEKRATGSLRAYGRRGTGRIALVHVWELVME